MKSLFAVLFFALAVNSQLPDSRCPPGTPDPPAHLNDPEDCSRFFTCVGGNALPTNCPPGQHWSSINKVCDWLERAQCEASGKSECADENHPWPQDPVMFPHPTDCTRIIKCSWGVGMELECPPEQHWSVKLNRCEWQDVANCNSKAD